MSTPTSTILEQLEEQLTTLNNNIALATRERDRIAGAVAALRGDPVPKAAPATGALPRPTPVTELVMEMVRAASPGTTFDYKSAMAKTQTLFPTQAARIKTGIYTAVATLLKKKQLRLAPGGFQLHPEATV